MSHLDHFTAKQLMDVAAALEVKGYKSMTKAQLRDAINAEQERREAAEAAAEAEAQAAADHKATLEAEATDERTAQRYEALLKAFNDQLDKDQKVVFDFASDVAKSGVRHAVNWHGEEACLAEARLQHMTSYRDFVAKAANGENGKTSDEVREVLQAEAAKLQKYSLERLARGDKQGMNEGDYEADAFAALFLTQLTDDRNWNADDFRTMFVWV